MIRTGPMMKKEGFNQMHNHALLMAKLTNVPLLITPAKAKIVLGVMARESGYNHVETNEGGSLPKLGELPQLTERAGILDDEPIAVGSDRKIFPHTQGVAVIDVMGSLVNNLKSLHPYSGMVGYDGLRAQLNAAAADDEIRAIVFHIDSNGGEVSGCFDLADRIFEINQIKPVYSILAESAYSAAYCIASQSTKIFVPRTGGVGSIGVVCMHVDFSKALKQDGIKVTFIHAGEDKVKGNPFEPLPDDTRAQIQDSVMQSYDLFVSIVARGRGMSEDAVRDTEAGIFGSDDGVAAGLADAVLSPQQAMAQVIEELSGSNAGQGLAVAAAGETNQMGDSDMKTTQTAAATAETATKTGAVPAPAAEPAEQAEAGAEAVTDDQLADAQATGAKDERERISGILNCDEAKGKGNLASTLADQPDMTVDQAKVILGAAAAEATADGPTPLDAAMADEPNVVIGADSGATQSEADKVSQRMLANHVAAGGQVRKVAG